MRTLHAIDEADRLARGTYAQGPRVAWRAAATGARIDVRAVRGEAERRVGNLAARAAAPVGPCCESLERLAIQRQALALIEHFAIPVEPQARERAQDRLVGARHAARAVQVLDAHAPAAARGARIQPARQRGDE